MAKFAGNIKGRPFTIRCRTGETGYKPLVCYTVCVRKKTKNGETHIREVIVAFLIECCFLKRVAFEVGEWIRVYSNHPRLLTDGRVMLINPDFERR